jgi:threonine/homoserine/homoserine lactone efflux protein
LIVGLAAALGLGAVNANSRLLYEALRWGGVLYLFCLAWEAWQREEDPLTGTAGLCTR